MLFLVAFDAQTNSQAVFLVRHSLCSGQRTLKLNIFGKQQIDRHNTYREIDGFCFPHHEDPRRNLRNSLVDGELVLDTDPKTGQVRPFPTHPHICSDLTALVLQKTLRFLAFDCLVIDDQNVMSKTLDKRYGVSVLFPSCFPHLTNPPILSASERMVLQTVRTDDPRPSPNGHPPALRNQSERYFVLIPRRESLRRRHPCLAAWK